jgi:hypothetical protein
MKILERILYIAGLCLFCLALKAQPNNCFDNAHFSVKGEKVWLEKECFYLIAHEYNRCQEELEILDSLNRSYFDENQFWKKKYLSNKSLLDQKSLVLDSTSKAFYQSSGYLVKELNNVDQLHRQLQKAKMNQLWAGFSGFVGALGLLIISSKL